MPQKFWFDGGMWRRWDKVRQKKSPKIKWRPPTPPPEETDWPVVVLIGGCVVCAGVLLGTYLSSLLSN